MIPCASRYWKPPQRCLQAADAGQRPWARWPCTTRARAFQGRAGGQGGTQAPRKPPQCCEGCQKGGLGHEQTPCRGGEVGRRRAAKQNGGTTASTTACPAPALPLADQLVSIWPQPTVQFWIQGRLCCSRIKVWRHSHFVGAGRRRPLRSGLLSSGGSICSCRSRNRASSCAAKLLHRNGGSGNSGQGCNVGVAAAAQAGAAAAGKERSI